METSQTMSGNWDDFGFGSGNAEERIVLSDYRQENLSAKKGFNPKSVEFESHICSVDHDQRSMTASSSLKSGHMEDVKPLSSCNRCRPTPITSIQSNTVVPLTNPLPSTLLQQIDVCHNNGGSGAVFLSWFLPRIKKKHKNENSPNRTESEEVTQIIKDLGIVSIEALKKESIEAHKHRDAALAEVTKMRQRLTCCRQLSMVWVGRRISELFCEKSLRDNFFII